jgi:hypothetical protein
MSQSTIAAARQNEMKTSIAVVTTMICGRAREGAGMFSGVVKARVTPPNERARRAHAARRALRPHPRPA